MKIIVNSRTLANKIKQALEWDCTSVEVIGKDYIVFSNYTHSIEVGCAVTERSDSIKIDRISWYRVMKLCRSIPEQPITVVVHDEMIEVHCEHQFRVLNTLP